MMPPDAVLRVLLVGFMGSGKTRVGQALARRLGWSFRDFDQEIRLRMGLPIPEIFLQHGEERFREMEERVGAEFLQEEQVVLASGGGWPAAMGRMDELPAGTFAVWLQVTPAEAVRRVQQDGPTRPLLGVLDPVARAAEMLEAREPWYAKAHAALDSTRGGPEELAGRIEEWIKRRGPEGSLPPSTSA